MIASAVDAVTGLFSGNDSPEAISLLKEDHRKVDELFSRVKANEDADHTATFRKIKQELDLHAHIEEQIFYPHLLKEGDEELQKIVREGLEEHGQVKVLLSELAGLKGTSDTFKAKLKVLIENVEHHVEEEEDEMFPMVEDQIEAETRQRIGSLLLAEKSRMGGAITSSGTPRKAAAAGR